MKYLCFDISNMLYRTFHMQHKESEDTIAGLATHAALTTLNKYFRQHKPDKVVMAFDRPSWRKEYTNSELCVSKRLYKGDRRKNMTPSQQIKYQRFLEHVAEFERLIVEHTTIITLVGDMLEADDLIAGFCQEMATPDDEIVIISSDSDLLQLQRNVNVLVISPATDKPQSLEKYDNDPDYYLFTKCIRGDPTDNVQSAYPGVRETRIRDAYTDPYARVQLMKEHWTNENKTTFMVEDLFLENQLLIDLEKQPQVIRDLITACVHESVQRERKFSMFHMLKFVGKYKLVKIKESIDNYIALLSK